MADSLKPQYDELVARWVALSPERREGLLAEFLPDYVYNSEKIENSELTYETVRQIVETGGVTGYTGDVQLLIETYNLRLSWELARTKLAEAPCLSEELICQAQGLVTMGTYDEGRLLGIVTVDDALDVLEEEHAEDLRVAGGSADADDSGRASALIWLVRRNAWVALWAVGVLALTLELVGVSSPQSM